MRHVFSIILLFATFFSFAQLNEPDFAFPKRTLAQADSLLKVSTKAKDGVVELQALCIKTRAYNEIDHAKLAPMVDTLLMYANKQKNETDHALMTLFAATIAKNLYNNGSYSFSRRDIPLTPRPADMQEWSGEMFETYIDSLCLNAWQRIKTQPAKIADYQSVIEQEELSRQYYPLVRDFVALKAINLSLFDKFNKAIYDEWLALQPTLSKPYFAAWIKKDRNTSEIYELYKKNQDNNNAQILLSYLDAPKELMKISGWTPNEAIDFYAKAKIRVSGTWLESYPINAINSIKCPKLLLSANKSIMVPVEVNIKANYTALQGFTMNIYRGETFDITQKDLNKLKPISSPYIYLRNYQYSDQDTIINLDLEDGIYYIKGDYPVAGEYQKPYTNSWISFMVSRYVPVISQYGNNMRVVVVDAVNNIAASNVEVVLNINKKKIERRSDKKGVATFEKLAEKPTGLLVNGLPFDISQYTVAKPNKDNSISSLVCNTELGVYHPGDTVNFMVVKTINDRVAPDAEVSTVLYDAEGNEVSSIDVTTDDFGRAAASLPIKPEGKTGQYCLAVSSDKATNYKFFMVSDFKVNDYKFSDVEFWPNIPKKGKVTVKGKVLAFTGQPVADADVKILIGDDSHATVKSSADGAFDVVMPLPKNDDDNERDVMSYKYNLSVSAEITATMPSGESINYNTYIDLPFAYTLEVTANQILSEKFINSHPLICEAKITGPDKKAIVTPIKWSVCSLETDKPEATGESNLPNFNCDLTALPAGRYKFVISTADSTLARPYTRNITLYNPAKNEMPGIKTNIIWVENTSLNIDKYGKATCSYYVNAPEALIFFFDKEAERPENMLRYERIKQGWHTLVYAKPGEFTIYAIDRNRRQKVTINVSKATESGLKIITESIRDHFDCGASEKWSFKVVDSKNKGVPAAMVLDVYNSKLDVFYPNSFFKPIFKIPAKIIDNYLITQNFTTKRELYLYASVNRLRTQSLDVPDWRYNLTRRITGRVYGIATRSYKDSSDVVEMAMVEQRPMANFALKESENETAGQSQLDDVQERVEVFSALWRPDLTTDKNGRVEVPFTVPDAITQWQLKGIAWTADGRSARIDEVFTTDKAVTVNLNTPRFVRQGDRLRVAATVRNNTDNAMTADAMLSIGGRDSLLSVEIGPKSSRDLFMWHNVGEGDSLKISVKAATGNFADGEKVTIPVLPSSFNIVESTNFYLNPTDTVYSVAVPKSEGSDWSYKVDFTDNPMDLVADALPALNSKDMSETAICQSIAFYSSAVALQLMEEHPQHTWKFDKDELKKSMERSDKILVDLFDQGWRWGSWSKEPSPYITYAVLAWLADVRSYCSEKLSKCVADALTWIDSKVDAPSIGYALVRPQFGDVPLSLNAKTAIEKTMQSIVGAWRDYPLPLRAESATALDRNGYKNVAGELLKSLDEYLTHTPDRGAYFANFTGIYYYPTFLTAYSTVTPQSKNVDALRQYLLMRKQAQNWGNWPVTSDVVQSIINSGTPWLDVDDKAQITTSDGKITLSRKGGLPAYGAVTVNYLADADSIEAHTDGEISVLRNIYVQRDGKWQHVDMFKVGDRVKISMTLKASRAMSNVTLTDQRPAAFATVEQMPGYIYTDRTWAYRENRDAVSNFYIDYLPQGVSMFEYECFVTIPGQFVMGTANVSCDLAPSLNAHSSASKITVNE